MHSQWLTLQFYVQLSLKEQSVTKWVCTNLPSFQISQTHLNLRWRSFVTTKFRVARMHNNFKLNELKLLTNPQSKTKSKLIKSLLSLGKHETTTNVRSLLTEPCFFNFCTLATVTAPPIFSFCVQYVERLEVRIQKIESSVLFVSNNVMIPRKRIVSFPNKQLLDLTFVFTYS